MAIWRGKNPFKAAIAFSAGNLQLENRVMCNAHQFCHDSGFAHGEGCFFYQESGDPKQLLGDGGTRSRETGQSTAYWAGHGSGPSSAPEFYSSLRMDL